MKPHPLHTDTFGGRGFVWILTRSTGTSALRNPAARIRSKTAAWDLNSIWVDPGWLVMAFSVSALPAFVVGMIIVHELRLLGISEILSSMIAMPLLIFAWYYSSAG